MLELREEISYVSPITLPAARCEYSSMPGASLTRSEAEGRCQKVGEISYHVDLDLSGGGESFESTTRLEFNSLTPGEMVQVDLTDAVLHELVFNGEALDPSVFYSHGKIILPCLSEKNEVVVRATCNYSLTGEGLHRFQDPIDDRIYLYTQFEVADASRVFAAFDQPDLKAHFIFSVTVPEHWVVVSNSAGPSSEPTGDGRTVWRFPPTARISTYVAAVIAGEYHQVTDVYEGVRHQIPLGLLCRQSLVPYLDSTNLFELTRTGLSYFEEAFDWSYPFDKYDQIFVPEFNLGAMENVACVTIRDDFLAIGAQPRSFFETRAYIMLHELAHMWFGNLVTMRWWDDLWLNESFADWASYSALEARTEFTTPWAGFASSRKQGAYRQDQMSTTHPVVATVDNLSDAGANFDGITYSKGAAVLKQLCATIGIDAFLAGLREYFVDFAYMNTEFTDLLKALERSSGQDLREWADAWLGQPGVNTISPQILTDSNGAIESFNVSQGLGPNCTTLRTHLLRIGFYNFEHGRLVSSGNFEAVISGSETKIGGLYGQQHPDLVVLNDGDLSYAKVRFDARSQASVIRGLGTIEGEITRAVCWTALWEAARDSLLRPRDYVSTVLHNIGTETNALALERVLEQGWSAATVYSSPQAQRSLREQWEFGVRKHLGRAKLGSGAQLSFARAYVAAAHTQAGLSDLEDLLSGSLQFEALDLNTDLRWLILTSLSRAGRVGHKEIEEELRRNPSIESHQHAAGAKAARPSVSAKAEAWDIAVGREDIANETQRSVASAFHQYGQDELLSPYVPTYLTMATTVWTDKGPQRGRTAIELLFPTFLASQTVADAVDDWIESSSAPTIAKRFVRERHSEMVRALAAQAFDAKPGALSTQSSLEHASNRSILP